MKNLLLLGFLAALTWCSTTTSAIRTSRSVDEVKGAILGNSSSGGRLSSYVDTRIGTGGFAYGIGQIQPGPQVPFGAMRLGPDTSLGLEPLRLKFDHYGGYYYKDDFIECFSHTHLDGAGLGDLQNFGVTVVRGPVKDETVWFDWYRSNYSHDTEVAIPGYYAVTLEDANTRAELTVAGTHAGLHRYTCMMDNNDSSSSTSNRQCTLLLDICHAAWSKGFFTPNAACQNATLLSITDLPSSSGGGVSITAKVYNHGSLSGNGFYIYFMMNATAIGQKSGTRYSFNTTGAPTCWVDGQINLKNPGLAGCPVGKTTTSRSLGVLLTVNNPSALQEDLQFDVSSAISFIDEANLIPLSGEQLLNHTTSQPLTFEEAVSRTQGLWEETLSTVDVATTPTNGSNNTSSGEASYSFDIKSMYSSLYRAHLAPTIYTELGQYLGEDMMIHNIPHDPAAAGNSSSSYNFMSDLSIWDIYRSQQPLLLLLNPEASRNTCWSMLQMYKQRGDQLPKWVLFNQETGTMVGHHSAVILSDAVRKGLKGLNMTELYDAVVHGIRQQNMKMDPNGYVSWEGSGYGAGSKTLDYSVDAGAVLALAQMLGDNSTAAEFEPYANAYKKVWNSTFEVFCPRWGNGTFWCPEILFAPYPFEKQLTGHDAYTEGDAVQYRWYVPHDLNGLVSLFQSPSDYAQKLNDFFVDAQFWPLGNDLPNPWFWAGNEPDILAPAQFPYAGPEYGYLCDKWFPETLKQYYMPAPPGLPGNDDFGTMSAFGFFSAVGLYPVASTNDYVLFTPRFSTVSFYVSGDSMRFSPFPGAAAGSNSARAKIIEIRCNGHPGTEALSTSATTYYVANATVNGVSLMNRIVTHEQLMHGLSEGEAAVIELTISTEASVFGQPLPSQGGPMPFQPKKSPLEREETQAVAMFEQIVEAGKSSWHK